jgi:hypothetical protein
MTAKVKSAPKSHVTNESSVDEAKTTEGAASKVSESGTVDIFLI